MLCYVLSRRLPEGPQITSWVALRSNHIPLNSRCTRTLSLLRLSRSARCSAAHRRHLWLLSLSLSHMKCRLGSFFKTTHLAHGHSGTEFRETLLERCKLCCSAFMFHLMIKLQLRKHTEAGGERGVNAASLLIGHTLKTEQTRLGKIVGNVCRHLFIHLFHCSVLRRCIQMFPCFIRTIIVTQ